MTTTTTILEFLTDDTSVKKIWQLPADIVQLDQFSLLNTKKNRGSGKRYARSV